MPVIDGIDVATLLERDGPMTPQLAVKVIDQLASALDSAHAAGLVHRDVKPSNALMTHRDFVYLIDFGIAHDAAATRLTQTGAVLGTLAYMAPERYETGIADARADVYALAAVLHECLTGSQPFPGDSLPQQMRAHLYHDPPRPSIQRPGVPTGFDAVVAQGMAKDPERRYQTALELAAAAHQALTETSSVPAVHRDRLPSEPTVVDHRADPADPTLVRDHEALVADPPSPQQLAGPGVSSPAVGPVGVGGGNERHADAVQVDRSPHAFRALGPARWCILAGVILVAVSAAFGLVPWRGAGTGSISAALTWLVMIGIVAGIALLALGRRRGSTVQTILGCALVSVGVATSDCSPSSTLTISEIHYGVRLPAGSWPSAVFF